MNLPDLQQESGVTLEHCSVLLEKIGRVLGIMDGIDSYDVVNEINPQLLMEHYEEHFDPPAFARMFKTELGKGVLVGTYVQRLLERIKRDGI